MTGDAASATAVNPNFERGGQLHTAQFFCQIHGRAKGILLKIRAKLANTGDRLMQPVLIVTDSQSRGLEIRGYGFCLIFFNEQGKALILSSLDNRHIPVTE